MGSIAPAGMRRVAAAVSKNAERYSFTGPHVESLRSSNACCATTPATWCWPWPSRGVPVKIDTTICGRNRRITTMTSASTESRGQKRNDSAPVLEKPRSEEHTSELQSPCNLVCRLLLEKKKSDAD